MNFRSIRIALNLSLIVAMASQPVLALGINGGDSRRHGDKQQLCHGCGCCELAPAENQCCCGPAQNQTGRADADDAKTRDGIGERDITADCSCGITKFPMDRRHHRQSTIDFSKLRVSSLPVVDLLSESDPKSFHLQPAWRGDTHRLGRYSQQYLCVWRI